MLRLVNRSGRVSAWLLLAAALGGAHPAAAAEDGERGRVLYNNLCRTCHSVQADENRLGPSLAGIVGRKAGSQAGFSYTPAMVGAGFTWDEGRLDRFLAEPEAVVPGNGMKPYGGMPEAAERAALIGFLAKPN